MGMNKVICPWVSRESFTPEPKRKLVRNIPFIFFDVKHEKEIHKAFGKKIVLCKHNDCQMFKLKVQAGRILV